MRPGPTLPRPRLCPPWGNGAPPRTHLAEAPFGCLQAPSTESKVFQGIICARHDAAICILERAPLHRTGRRHRHTLGILDRRPEALQQEADATAPGFESKWGASGCTAAVVGLQCV